MAQKQLTIPLPNINSPLVRVEVQFQGRKLYGNGFILSPWNSFLQQISQNPSAVIDVTLDSSPFSITPNAHGTIIITDGTISNITLTRGNIDIDITGQRIIPIRISDTLSVTYSVLPILQFLPN